MTIDYCDVTSTCVYIYSTVYDYVDEKFVALPPDSLDWTSLPGNDRREMAASSVLLEGSRPSDGTAIGDAGSGDPSVDRRAAAAAKRRNRESADVGRASSTSADNESLKTPDSLLTSELLDDSVFDGELDWIGTSSFHWIIPAFNAAAER